MDSMPVFLSLYSTRLVYRVLATATTLSGPDTADTSGRFTDKSDAPRPGDQLGPSWSTEKGYRASLGGRRRGMFFVAASRVLTSLHMGRRQKPQGRRGHTCRCYPKGTWEVLTHSWHAAQTRSRHVLLQRPLSSPSVLWPSPNDRAYYAKPFSFSQGRSGIQAESSNKYLPQSCLDVAWASVVVPKAGGLLHLLANGMIRTSQGSQVYIRENRVCQNQIVNP